MAHLGGLRIIEMRWQSASAIVVRFVSGHAGKFHQLYAGRRLLAETDSPEQRELIAHYPFARWPEHWRVIAVDDDEAGIDQGADFPIRPENVAKIQFNTTGWPADSDLIELFSSLVPGGSVDNTNRIAEILYAGEKDYEILTPPLAGSGAWEFEVQGRDNKPDGGNAGTGDTATVDILAHPPDFDTDFSLSVSGGSATFTVTVPED